MRHMGKHRIGKGHWASIFKWYQWGAKNMQKMIFFEPQVATGSSMGLVVSKNKILCFIYQTGYPNS
uniref:Uncharacterized protein n=1 Tax=Romanomermis culicivorax TaxID=13658 RepID=A0A915K0J9_ROMCU